MPKLKLSEVELAYEVEGKGPAILLVAGLGMQLIHWPDGFVRGLAELGYRVIRFDLRDSGASTTTRLHARPRLVTTLAGLLTRGPESLPYLMVDLARDGVELLDALGEHAPAHIIGMSMGGAVAQTMAVHFADRVKSLVSISSTTGAARASVGSLEGIRSMLTRPARTRDEARRIVAPLYVRVSGKRYPRTLADAEALALRAFDRSSDPWGHDRLLWAMIAAGDRTHELARVRCPSLVLHGEDDLLIPVAGGRATARAIPRARLRVLPGMGHDLPEPLWPLLLDAIGSHCKDAEHEAVEVRP